jgi:hypothetical protein
VYLPDFHPGWRPLCEGWRLFLGYTNINQELLKGTLGVRIRRIRSRNNNNYLFFK